MKEVGIRPLCTTTNNNLLCVTTFTSATLQLKLTEPSANHTSMLLLTIQKLCLSVSSELILIQNCGWKMKTSQICLTFRHPNTM